MIRDKDDNQNSFRNISKGILAGTAGAILFKQLGGSKFLSDNLPKANKFLKAVSEDLSEMKLKDYNYNNISRLYKEHISNQESTLKRIINEVPENKLKNTGNNLISAIVRYNELEKSPDEILRKLFNDRYIEELSENINKKYTNNNKILNDQINLFLKKAIDKNELIKFYDEDNALIDTDFIEKYINIESIKDKDSFFKDLVDNLNPDTLEDAFDNYKNREFNEETKSYNIIDNILKQYTDENLRETFGTPEAYNTIFNELKGSDRPLTLKEFISRKNEFKDQILSIGNKKYSLLDMIEEFASNRNIDDLVVDANNLKINKNNEIINSTKSNEIIDNIKRNIAGTIPGKILKISDSLNNEAGSFNLLRRGTSSLLLSNIDKNERYLKNSYAQILNSLYKINKDDTLSKIDKLGEMDFLLSYHGSQQRLLRNMFGLNSEKDYSNKYYKLLDIGKANNKNILEEASEQDSLFGKIARKFTNTTTYNYIDKVIEDSSNLSKENAIEYRNNLKKISNAYATITNVPNTKTLKELKKYSRNNNSKQLLELLIKGDDESIINMLYDNKNDIENRDLYSLVNLKKINRSRANRILSIKSDNLTNSKNVFTYSDLLKRETVKEILLKESKIPNNKVTNYNRILETLNKLDISNESKKNLNNLSSWIVLQNEGMLYGSNKNEKILDIILEKDLNIAKILTAKRKTGTYGNKDTSYIINFQENIKNLKNNYKSLTTVYKNDYKATNNTLNRIEHCDIIAMRKAYTPINYALDIINDLNNKEKIKANTKRFGMQFIAGKDNPEYITKYTMIPYFFIDRLMTPFNKIGLGFSGESTKNSLSYASNILLKRVAPIALGITAYQYLDFEAKNFTGTSITGALAQGIANVDLGLRKIADVTGIGKILETERKLNPISQYWLGDDYQNAEERKKYYENGYSPVRKGRFWSFGSASEFRGNKISYYQPNLVKRINSDWRNESIYGGSNEKWKHSFIPTPRHPLAPIRRLLDPYWLERKHYEDRPYMQTAPLFSTGTPWGAILNPTLGEIIKPVKNMHRLETKRGLIDPRTLIAERNARIKAKANKNNNLIKISANGINNVEYKPYALSDENKAIINLRINNEGIKAIDYNGIDYTDTIPKAKDIDYKSNNIIYNTNSNANTNIKYNINITKRNRFNLFNLFETTSLGSEISNSIGYSEISNINRSIKINANNKKGTVLEKTNLAEMPSNIASQMINTKQDEADLLLNKSRYDFISDALFSGKQLSGIYGFLAGFASPKTRRIQKENANNIASFTRAFWDSNLGGLGGGIMEIARRFFPHENHSIVKINNIRNTMPDWMPERFKVGDPYTKIQKGEMRLPGKGYESINKLHSDAYGKYGALDRMKILADIAPWSEEYKLWRDVAQKTVTDTKGKKEIKEIKARVQKQSSAHEFYEYKFLKNPSKVTSATVTAINNSTIYTKSGKAYNLAGITLKDKNALLNYIQPGSKINIEYLKSDKDNDKINAAIYIDGRNINKSLLESGQATKKDKLDAIGSKALTGQFGQLYGATMEAIGHAPIPFIHNKFMRIDTPLESYKNEQVYGTSYSTWEHPIKGFLKPSLQKAWGRDIVGQSVALGGWYLAEKIWNDQTSFKNMMSFLGKNISDTTANKTASVIMNVLNPGAFVGSMLGALPTGLLGEDRLKGLLSLDVFGAGVKSGIGRNFARAGATIGLVGYSLTRANNPFKSSALFSIAGMAFANQLQKEGFGIREGFIAGAITGIGISALKNPGFNKDKMFGKYIPKDTKKRRDIEEYYDRLEYIKYSGLYKKAARRAKLFEGVDVIKLFNKYEYNKKNKDKQLEKINNKLNKINNSNLESNRKNELLNKLLAEKEQLTSSDILLKGGKYTKAAVAYKQAMDSTIYGLNRYSSMQQVLRAIPKSDKDYFLQFMQEKNKSKRRKILKYVSPYERKALQIAWGEDNIDKPKNNFSFFKDHKLPGVFWSGWTPQVDLEKVKIKTIENEGMLLSDFGYYDSESTEPSTINAPFIDEYNKGNSNTLTLQSKITTILNGAGLTGVKVTVEPTNRRGIQVISNITNSLKITEYKIQKELNKFTGARLFY